MASLAEPGGFTVLTGEIGRLQKRVTHWQNRAHQRKLQRDLWKKRWEEERQLRLAAERALVAVGREAA